MRQGLEVSGGEIVSGSVCSWQALAKCSEMRPSVDISVGGDNSTEGVGVGGARVEYRSTVAA